MNSGLWDQRQRLLLDGLWGPIFKPSQTMGGLCLCRCKDVQESEDGSLDKL